MKGIKLRRYWTFANGHPRNRDTCCASQIVKGAKIIDIGSRDKCFASQIVKEARIIDIRSRDTCFASHIVKEARIIDTRSRDKCFASQIGWATQSRDLVKEKKNYAGGENHSPH